MFSPVPVCESLEGCDGQFRLCVVRCVETRLHVRWSVVSDMPATTVSETRLALQRVSTHILARRRAFSSGRFGLRSVHGGIATPAFGDALEVVRLTADAVIVEEDGASRAAPLTCLNDLATFVDVDLERTFSVGQDTPAVGDATEPLDIDPVAARTCFSWFGDLAVALDQIIRKRHRAKPSAVQLWPEHFDIACDLAWGFASAQRVNIGGSLGDEGLDEPYVYVGPWGSERPGSAPFWNASFGATLTRAQLLDTDGPVSTSIAAFFDQGITRLEAW